MKVLIYDNSKEFQDAIARSLKAGYETDGAETFQKAREFVRNNDYDAVVSFIGNAEGNESGINLLKLIRSSGIDTPVIMTASGPNISLAVDCFKLGANDFIDKTGISDAVIKKIKESVDNAVGDAKTRGNKQPGSGFRILFLDDNAEFTDAIKYYFGKKYSINVLNDFQLFREHISKNGYDCIFMDIKDEVNNRDQAGIDLLRECADYEDLPPVIMLTGWGEMSTAIECLKLGAYNFMEKSIKIFDTVEKVGAAIEELIAKKQKEERTTNKAGDNKYRVIDIIGESGMMRSIRREIIELGNHDIPVLIYGETGTGKELVSSAIHTASTRRGGNFVEIDCGTIPESIFESELFGYEKGAFTGALNRKTGKIEMAHNGTLFMDEVENITLEQQAKLLRVLEEKTIFPLGSSTDKYVDFRLICATNIDLFQLVEQGRFREDLLFRISAFHLKLPPLRERGEEDIELLIRYFLENSSCTIEKDALDLLKKYDWPGNARELKNVLKRFEIIARGNKDNIISLNVAKEGFMKFNRSKEKVRDLIHDVVNYYDSNVPKMLKDFEDIAVLNAYKEFNRNISKIAQKVYQESPDDIKNYRGRVRKVLERNKMQIDDNQFIDDVE